MALTPASSRFPPGGWTVGDGGQLLVAPTTESGSDLEVDSAYEATDGGQVFALVNSASEQVFTVQSDGRVRINARADEVALVVNHNVAPTTGFLSLQRIDLGQERFRIDKNGNPVLIGSHAAPADADLVAGDCALWFDQANGAAKLMVKAKEAGGTVRTATIALA